MEIFKLNITNHKIAQIFTNLSFQTLRKFDQKCYASFAERKALAKKHLSYNILLSEFADVAVELSEDKLGFWDIMQMASSPP